MRGRCKPEPKPLTAKSPWVHQAVYQHRGAKVLCVAVQDGRYWRAKGYIHRSPDEAMDRIEGKLG